MFAGLKGGFLAKKGKQRGARKKTKKLANNAEGAKRNDQKQVKVEKQVKAGPAQPPSANASPAGDGDADASAALAKAKVALAKVLELISRNEVEFNGVTKKILLNEKQFQQAMYPLDTKTAIEKKGLPTSFQKLISSEQWRKRLLAIMPEVCVKVESIVAGVKARAAKTEQPLDAYSEMVLRPQILLEAFGRAVIKMMHAIGREQHVQMSRSDKHLASIESVKADEEEWQLDDSPVAKSLIPHGFLVQDEFLGSDWVEAVHTDARRCFTEGQTAGFVSNPKEFGGLAMLMLDHTEKIQLRYPALWEAIDAVHSLPFELNKRLGSKLCTAVPGSTVLFRFIPGCTGWKERLDGSESNGYAATALYVIGRQSSVKCAPFRVGLHGSHDASRVVSCQSDQLILFDDCSTKNSFQTEDDSKDKNEWFLICFWIHGTNFRRL